MTRQGCHVYLNGHKVHTYEWWSGPEYSSILFDLTETKHLKKGINSLAVYPNLNHEKGQTRGLTDVYVGGLNMRDLTKYDTCPPAGGGTK
jgi:hypothetical protein